MQPHVRQFLFVLGLGVLLALALTTTAQQRRAACAAVPWLAPNLLPNANLAQPGEPPTLPQGWSAGAPGVQLVGFAVDGDERALQLMGLANYAQTPPIAVQPGAPYCFEARAISDAALGAGTLVRAVFRWHDAQGALLAEDTTPWQPVIHWQPDDPPAHWSHIRAAFRAPPEAATLHVRLRPAADDRIYLDALLVRQAGTPPPASGPAPQRVADLPLGSAEADMPQGHIFEPPNQGPVVIERFPNGQDAALSFSFDWETAMGGLVHSRSVGDPYADSDPVQRGLRMRAGVTSTLELFAPHGIRATYFATGYNFLHGNTERRTFMDNPTYDWATTANRWTSDRWQATPWFAPDPHGTTATHPAWYFGDLVPILQRAGQDIQSHTFSHFYGGFVGPDDWLADSAAFDDVARPHGVPSARVLAFPWSSSGGMTLANWDTLAAQGYTAVTRTSQQSPFRLFARDEAGLVPAPQCRPLPAHTQIVACPDFYLTPASADAAIAQIDRALAVGGVIDLWAHTEEVVSAEQRAAWQRVIAYAAGQPELWIAPLREITDWEHAYQRLTIEPFESHRAPAAFRLRNHSPYPLRGLRLAFAQPNTQIAIQGHIGPEGSHDRLTLDVLPFQTVEVEAWPVK